MRIRTNSLFLMRFPSRARPCNLMDVRNHKGRSKRPTEISSVTRMSSEELIVDMLSRVPDGYSFVRSGNVYITKNCRNLTHQAGQTVYVVRDSEKKRNCGLRVPKHIYKSVLKLHAETKDQRKEVVQKKDSAREKKVRLEISKMFPRIPQERIQKILKHMLVKRSGRVGRSKDVPLRQMAELAVKAHIRHKDTEYDELLRKGITREQARSQVKTRIDEVVKSWMSASSVSTKIQIERKLVTKRSKESIGSSTRRSSLRLKKLSESERAIDISGDPTDIDSIQSFRSRSTEYLAIR